MEEAPCRRRPPPSAGRPPPAAAGAGFPPWRSGKMCARMDEHGAWRRAVVRRLVLGARAWAPAPGGGVLSAAAPRAWGGAGDDTTTRSTSSGMAVGSRLHVERKPCAD